MTTIIVTRGVAFLVVASTMAVTHQAFASASAGFVYVLRDAGPGPTPSDSGRPNQIYGFRVNAVTGALTPLPGFPIVTGGTGAGVTPSEHLTYDGLNSRLYALNDGDDTLSAFSVNRTTGALTALPFNPVALTGHSSVACVAVHPSGSPVVIGDGIANVVTSLIVTATTATPAAGSPYPLDPDAASYACEISRDGSYFYTGGNGGTSFAGFSINAADGVLAELPGSPFASGGGSPVAYETDTLGRLFMATYSSGPSPATLPVFTTAFDGSKPAGVPFPVIAGPFPSGGLTQVVHGALHSRDLLWPCGFGCHKDSVYLVVDRASNVVGVYGVSGPFGAATELEAMPGSPFGTGGLFSTAMTLSADGQLVFVANSGSRNLSTFALDTSGALTSLGVQPVDTVGTSGTLTGLTYVPVPTEFDFDGDARADLSVFRPSMGTWEGVSLLDHTTTILQQRWGADGDIPVAADYDGDGKADLAVFRPSTGVWWIVKSGTNNTVAVAYGWGVATDIPVPADYDGDQKADLAIYRPSTGVWWILTSSTNFTTYTSRAWGVRTDRVVPADYDGDGVTDLAVFRPSTGQWWIWQSSTNSAAVYLWGIGTDRPVPGDYDGDGRSDLAVFRPSTGVWWFTSSSNGFGTISAHAWGLSTDTLIPGDYDGDGKTDLAVYRPSTKEWWILNSSSGYSTVTMEVFGQQEFIEIPIARR